MKKSPFIFLLCLILTISCSGILWDSDESDELTISIDNPFYQESTASPQSSRALALQGTYLYIELALITDQALYNADTGKLLTGNGTWVPTAWGGHAIVTLPISTLNTIEATFVDVPRDQPLQARVFLDLDKTIFESNFELYGSDEFPICRTYNSAGLDFYEQSWISISVEDLNTNVISLSIRPETLETVFWGSSGFIADDYMSAAQTIPLSSDISRFFLIGTDLSVIQIRDLVFYVAVDGEWTSVDIRPPNTVLLYENDGMMVPEFTPVIDTVSVPHTYKSLHTVAHSLSDYTSPNYFLGSNLLYTINDGSYSTSTKWNVSFGILYDSNMTTAEASGISVNWTLPAGLVPGDLDFKILHIDNTVITNADLDTMDKINTYAFAYESAWNDALMTPTGNSYNLYNLGYYPSMETVTVLLARVSGGNPFIYGRAYIPGP